jgi:septal ring factor EnvC (AmiA/AmiB activator)
MEDKTPRHIQGILAVVFDQNERAKKLTTRLVACWNACREMDDPAERIRVLTSIASRCQDLEKFLAVRDKELNKAHDTQQEQHKLIVKLNKEIDRLASWLSDRDTKISEMEEAARKRNGAYEERLREIERLEGLLEDYASSHPSSPVKPVYTKEVMDAADRIIGFDSDEDEPPRPAPPIGPSLEQLAYQLLRAIVRGDK